MRAPSAGRGLTVAGALSVLLFVAFSSAYAQAPYQPSMPTLSPWFGLFERSAGPLPSYHYFVRPRREFQHALEQQQATTRRQGATLGALGQEVSQMERKGTIRPTGTGSVFMDYSHYYPQSKSGSVQVRPRNWTPPPPRTTGGEGAY